MKNKTCIECGYTVAETEELYGWDVCSKICQQAYAGTTDQDDHDDFNALGD